MDIGIRWNFNNSNNSNNFNNSNNLTTTNKLIYKYIYVALILLFYQMSSVSSDHFPINNPSCQIGNEPKTFDKEIIKPKTLTLNKSFNGNVLNDENTIYELIVHLGSKLQTLKILLNTGDSNSWIRNITCKDCSEAYNPFDPYASITYKDLGVNITSNFSKTINFKLNGTLSQDNITFLETGKLPEFQFSLVNWMERTINKVLDGSLGLGIPTEENKSRNFMYNLSKNKIIDSNIFSLSLITSLTSSSITLGGYDSSIVTNSSKINYCNVDDSEPSRSSWGCKFNQIKFSNNTFNKSIDISRTLVFDSVSTLITIPKKDFILFKDYIFRDDNDCQYFGDNLFHCTCNNNDYIDNFAFPKLEFIFNRSKGDNENNSNDVTKLYMDSSDYILMDTDILLPESNCIMGIRLRYDDSDEWIVGNNFLKNYYTIFNYDNKTIGFYDVRDNYNSYIIVLVILASVAFVAILLFLILFYIFKKCVHSRNVRNRNEMLLNQ